MTARERTGLQVLGVLVVVVAAGYYVRSRAEVPADGGRTPSNRVSASKNAGGAPLPIADVKLEQLTRAAAGELDDASRNPFRFKPKPPPPPPPVVQRPVSPQPVAPPVPQGPPPPPPIALRLIGLVEAAKPADRIAIFSDPRPQGQGSPVYGKEGDIIEGRYRVLRVGSDSAELAYLDGRGRQTLRMSGQ